MKIKHILSIFMSAAIAASLSVIPTSAFTLSYNNDERDLKTDKTVIFDVPDIMPRDEITEEITFTNSGSTDVDLYFKIDDSNAAYSADDRTLLQQLKLTVKVKREGAPEGTVYNDVLWNLLSSQRADSIGLGTCVEQSDTKISMTLIAPQTMTNAFSSKQLNLVWAFSVEDESLPCAPPVISPVSGTYLSGQAVTITSLTEGADIYYTIDGQDPVVGASNTRKYEGQFILNDNTTVKAIAVKKGHKNSTVSQEDYIIKVRTPVIKPASRTFTYEEDHTITITCDTPGADIYYTLDGTDPTNNSIKYTGPFQLPSSAQVRAIGYKPTALQSDVAMETYIILPREPKKSAAPLITPISGIYESYVTVTITAAPNATIYYTTDGSEPTINSPVYTGKFDVYEETVVKAMAIEPEDLPSDVSSEHYQIQIPCPKILPEGDIYTEPIMVKITCRDEDAVIHYTTNGSTPTEDSKVYTKPFELEYNTVVRAIAVAPGKITSKQAKEEYEFKTPTPVISPRTGYFNEPVDVTITCKDKEAKIYYTTDGSIPTVNSKVYSGKFVVSDNTKVTAVALHPDKILSDSTSESYFFSVPAPVITPESGLYMSSVTVTIKCDDPDAVIRYTTDGKTPTLSSPIYKGPFIVTKNTTVKAIATKEGLPESDVTTEEYQIKVEAPIIEPKGGIYEGAQKITIYCNTPNAIIYYGIDDEPIDKEYKGPFTISESCKVRAIAKLKGAIDSDITQEDYIIDYPIEEPPAPPPADVKTGVDSQNKTNYGIIFTVLGFLVGVGGIAFINAKNKTNKKK